MGKIANYEVNTLTRTFLSDVSANRFPKGKITHAGSSILPTPFSELIEFYDLSAEDVRRFMKILRMSVLLFFDIVPAPIVEKGSI